MATGGSPITFTSPFVYDCQEDFFETFKFTRRHVLGEGASGHVVLAESCGKTKALRAIKVIPFAKDAKKKQIQEEKFAQEVSILANLNHKHVMSDVAAAKCPTYFAICMTFYPNGTLDALLDSHQGLLPLDQIVRYTLQLCWAVRYLHDSRVFHGDMKLENVLLDGKNDLILSDFGHSQILTESDSSLLKSTKVGGTVPYIAPEVETCKEVDAFKVDAFATGVVLWCLVTGKNAYDHDQRDFLPILQASQRIPATLRQLIASLLEYNPDKRWTVHHFYDKFKFVTN